MELPGFWWHLLLVLLISLRTVKLRFSKYSGPRIGSLYITISLVAAVLCAFDLFLVSLFGTGE